MSGRNHPWLSAQAIFLKGLPMQPWRTTTALGFGAASLRDL